MKFSFNKSSSATLRLRNPKKSKIIFSLFFISVMLLIFNITLELIYKNKIPARKQKKEIKLEETNKKFKSALLNLGLEDSWINLKKGRKQGNLFYNVSVPEDLPIINILKEINDSFKDYDVDIKTRELKINGKTSLQISSGKIEVGRDEDNSNESFLLTSEFYYHKSLIRNAGSIGIFIAGIDQLKNDNLNDFLSIPEDFEILLVPSKFSKEVLTKLSLNKRTYGVLFNDDIRDLDYKLNDTYSKARLKSSIRNIIGNFPAASIYLIKNNSNLFLSNVYPLLKQEFKKRNISLIPTDSLSDLTNESITNALVNFQTIVTNVRRGEKAEFVLSTDEFKTFQPELMKYRKIGYKFVIPSELIKNISSN